MRSKGYFVRNLIYEIHVDCVQDKLFHFFVLQERDTNEQKFLILEFSQLSWPWSLRTKKNLSGQSFVPSFYSPHQGRFGLWVFGVPLYVTLQVTVPLSMPKLPVFENGANTSPESS